MDKPKQFMRYALPGLVIVLIFGINTIITNGNTRNYLSELIKGDKSAAIIGIIITGFIASGALGYLCAMIYFVLCRWIGMSLNHKPIIAFMEKNGYLLRGFYPGYQNETIIDSASMSKGDALALANSVWFHIKGESDSVNRLDEYFDKLSDILHGIGTTFFGNIICFFIWFRWLMEWEEYYYLALLWFVIISIIYLNFILLKNYLEKVTNTSTITMLRQEKIRSLFNSYILFALRK